MKTFSKIIITGIFVLAVSLPAHSADTVRVVTKENAVRDDCRFFAPVAVKVRYGDPLDVISKEGDWLRVKFEDVEGCIHKSAITEKKFKKKAGSGGEEAYGGASSDEVALAGKGFNPAVEEQYRLNNPDMDFFAIDYIEETNVSDTDLVEFIEEGGLRQP